MTQAEMREKLAINKVINKLPALEVCGTPPDGKAKRRERRKQERNKNNGKKR